MQSSLLERVSGLETLPEGHSGVAFDQSASECPIYPLLERVSAIVGFVGMVHDFESRFDRHSRGRLRGSFRHESPCALGRRQIEPRAMMALVGHFRVASRRQH